MVAVAVPAVATALARAIGAGSIDSTGPRRSSAVIHRSRTRSGMVNTSVLASPFRSPTAADMGWSRTGK